MIVRKVGAFRNDGPPPISILVPGAAIDNRWAWYVAAHEFPSSRRDEFKRLLDQYQVAHTTDLGITPFFGAQRLPVGLIIKLFTGPGALGVKHKVSQEEDRDPHFALSLVKMPPTEGSRTKRARPEYWEVTGTCYRPYDQPLRDALQGWDMQNQGNAKPTEVSATTGEDAQVRMLLRAIFNLNDRA